MDTVLIGVGLLGAGLVLAAFAAITTGKLGNDDAGYYWLNIAGSVGILLSLIVQWNLPSFVLQIVWIIISGMGLLRTRKAPR